VSLAPARGKRLPILPLRNTLALSGLDFSLIPRIAVDHLVVVTHSKPIDLEARPLRQGSLPEGAVALGYYHDGYLVARGIVSPDAVEAIHGLLARPVSLALAAAEDPDGNIDARVCLVLPIDPDQLPVEDEEEEPQEPWKASVPIVPTEIESGSDQDDPAKPRLALLPIGNVVRGRKDRRHPGNVAEDAKEMLDNLVGGRAQDAVQKAIDDLLRSL
jgi:hypothetical protein